VKASAPWSTRDRLLLLCLWAIFAALVQRFWFLTDDSYISFRYSRNLALGNGLRFNLGEHLPVEGYSNLLWVLACAGIERLGLNIEFWPLIISGLCGGGLLTLVYRTMRMRLELDTTPAFLASLSVAAFPPIAVWSTGGLATMPFALLLFITFERSILRRKAIHGPSTCVAIVGLCLIRVEGAYWTVAILLLTAVSRRAAGERLGYGYLLASCALVATVVAQVTWRNAYYGLLVANTVSAKGGMSMARLERGLDYITGWTLTMLVPLLLIPAAWIALRQKRKAILLPLVAMAMAGFAFSILVSGDYMTFGRFMVPFWAFNVLLLGVMWQALHERGHRRTCISAALACVVIGLLPGWDVHLVPKSVRERFHFRHNTPRHSSEFEQWRNQERYAQVWAARGRVLKRWLKPGSSIVLDTGIGATAYYSDLFIHDRGGLVTRETAERPALSDRLYSPGHDMKKPMKFFLKYRPDTIIAEWPTRPALANQLERVRAKLERLGPDIEADYLVDFRPVPAWDAPSPHLFVVYARRIEEGESPEQVAALVDQRAADVLDGITPYRDVVMDGYPLPPWYRPEMSEPTRSRPR